MENNKIVTNRELSLGEALVPVVVLMALLAFNIFFKDGAWLGDYSNHFILLMSGALAAVVGFYNKTSFDTMVQEVWSNLKSVFVPIMILLLVGALAGTWLISGIIPAMEYYGLKVMSPEIFMPASVVIAAMVSIATGSSWTTSATVGVALIGIGGAMDISLGMVAGAVISGAYFGDKMSPLSDTTNLAPAMAGTDLFTHIRYMAFTTVPSILIALAIFALLSPDVQETDTTAVTSLLVDIEKIFDVTPALFLVPAAGVALIILKVKPLAALGSGVVLAIVFAFIYQPDILAGLSESSTQSVINAVLTDSAIATDNENLADLFQAG